MKQQSKNPVDKIYSQKIFTVVIPEDVFICGIKIFRYNISIIKKISINVYTANIK